ncbi:hypothetical protein MnTg02_00695 [bacterium MnTg02]|nr:hypothetical protein MnTg02_00695 [bacterium MnTg02]
MADGEDNTIVNDRPRRIVNLGHRGTDAPARKRLCPHGAAGADLIGCHFTGRKRNNDIITRHSRAYAGQKRRAFRDSAKAQNFLAITAIQTNEATFGRYKEDFAIFRRWRATYGRAYFLFPQFRPVRRI